jgi:chemotaxis protein histidine kinase CheA
VLNRLYRSLHTIKGNASLLELDFLADQAHHAEDVVAQIKDKMKLVTKDRRNLQNQIDAIHKTYNELQDLINHIARIHDHFRPKRNHEQKQLLISIERLISTVSKGYHKKVKFDYSSFDAAGMPFKHRLLVRDILVQLARNSVYHGIESPAQRRQTGKPETGLIRLTGEKQDSSFIIGFHDDGKGINTEELKKKATESGKWKRDQIASWTECDMINTIFEPGITTADKTDLTAGRGIGLDLIRQKISRVGGDISVATETGKGTSFTIVLPVNDRQPENVNPVSSEETVVKED